MPGSELKNQIMEALGSQSKKDLLRYKILQRAARRTVEVSLRKDPTAMQEILTILGLDDVAA